jgi:hypothetical protein
MREHGAGLAATGAPVFHHHVSYPPWKRKLRGMFHHMAARLSENRRIVAATIGATGFTVVLIAAGGYLFLIQLARYGW